MAVVRGGIHLGDSTLSMAITWIRIHQASRRPLVSNGKEQHHVRALCVPFQTKNSSAPSQKRFSFSVLSTHLGPSHPKQKFASPWVAKLQDLLHAECISQSHTGLVFSPPS